MKHHVIVSFGKDQEFDYQFPAGDLVGKTAEDARRWFEREFDLLRCAVETPTGKILVVDRILSVAKYAGEAHFRSQPDWAGQFARNAAVLLTRELIRVDVLHYVIGY